MKGFQIFIIALFCITSIAKAGGKGGNSGRGGGSSRGGSNNRDKQGGWNTNNTPGPVQSTTSNSGSEESGIPSGWSSSNTQTPDSTDVTNTDTSNTDNDYNSGSWSNTKATRADKGNDSDIGGGRKNNKDDCWGKKRKRKKKRGNGKRRKWRKGIYCDDDDGGEIWMSSTWEPIGSTEETGIWDTDTDDSTTTAAMDDSSTTVAEANACVPRDPCPCLAVFAPLCCGGIQYDNECMATCNCQFECEEGLCPGSDTGSDAGDDIASTANCPDSDTEMFDATTPCECFKDQFFDACPDGRCQRVMIGQENQCQTVESEAQLMDKQDAGGFLSGADQGTTVGFIGGLIGAIVLVSCCLIIAIVVYCKRKNKKQYDNVDAMDEVEGIEDGRAAVTGNKATETMTGLDGEDVEDGEDSEIGHITGKTQTIIRYDSSDDDEEDVSDGDEILVEKAVTMNGAALDALIADGNDTYKSN